jgi:hypothetical protein
MVFSLVMEGILIFIVFAAAVFYVCRMVYNAFFAQSTAGCAKGCGSCQTSMPTFAEDLSQPNAKS